MIVRAGAQISADWTADTLSCARALDAWAQKLDAVPSKTEALQQSRTVLSAVRLNDPNAADALIEQLSLLGPRDLNGVKRWARSTARVAAWDYFAACPQQLSLEKLCDAIPFDDPALEAQMRATQGGHEQALRDRLARGQNVLVFGHDVRYDPIADTFAARWVANLAVETATQPLVIEEAPARVVISVLVWNAWENTQVLLPSLAKIDTPNVELVMLDNASKESLLDGVRRWYEENRPPFVLTLMRSKENLGFDEGNNVIIDYALHGQGLADYVYFLNDDTRVAPDFLSESLQVIRSKQNIGAVGSKVFCWRDGARQDDTGEDAVQFAGSELWVSPDSEVAAIDKSTAETEWAHGAGVLITRKVLEHVGAWDPRFFAYVEEMDLARRMQNAGFTTIVALKSRVWHKSPRELFSVFSIRMNVRNIFLFSRKHNHARSFGNSYRTVLSIIWFIRTAWMHVLSQRQLAYIWAPYQGMIEGLLGRFSSVQYKNIDEAFSSRREPRV